jgi:hypothetical protein
MTLAHLGLRSCLSWRRTYAVSGWRSCLCARFLCFPRSFSAFFLTHVRSAVSARTLFRWFTPPGSRLSEQCAVANTLGTLHKLLVSMGGYQIGEGLVEYVDRSAFGKRYWVRKHLFETLRAGFYRRWSILETPPLDRVASPAATLLRPA